MRQIHFAVMLYLLLVAGEPQLRGGTLPEGFRRPFEVIDRRGDTGINLGAGDDVRIKVSGNVDFGGAVLGAPVEEATRPTGQR
jgi:hypothetical protein